MKKMNEIPLKLAAALAMLAAISIILGKYLAIPGGEVLRFSFENLPIILAGVAFGPLAGALVGAVADLLGCLMVGYTINPMVTLGAVTIGTVSGIVYRLLGKTGWALGIKVCLSVAISHLIGSVIIKTFGLSVYYDMPFFVLMAWRALNYLIVGVLEGVLVYALLRNKMVYNQIASMKIGNRSGEEKR